MTLWQWMTAPIPLVDGRDVLARVGVRFVWCTFPCFAFVLTWSAIDPSRPVASPLTFFALAIPVLGGLLDWYRITRKPATPPADVRPTP